MRAGIFASGYVAPAGGGGLVGTYQTSAVDTSNASTYTFTSQPIGSASSTRRVVVTIAWRTGSGTLTPPSSVTIGGVSASIDSGAANAGGNAVAIASAIVTSGTTATVVVNLSESSARCGIGVWSLTEGDLEDAVDNSGTTTIDLALTTTSGAFIVGVAATNNSSFGYTWTNGTERYDGTVESGYSHSGADAYASGSSHTLQVLFGSSNTTKAAAAAYI